MSVFVYAYPEEKQSYEGSLRRTLYPGFRQRDV
jgi:hypothetical protein